MLQSAILRQPKRQRAFQKMKRPLLGGWGARLLFVFFNSFKGFWPPKVIIGLSIFIGGFWKDDISR
jgi:hypothetical protein